MVKDRMATPKLSRLLTYFVNIGAVSLEKHGIKEYVVFLVAKHDFATILRNAPTLTPLPEIDMDDWETNTIYSGLFESKGKRDRVVEWFWEVVRSDFDQEMKARLLQFVTGTSGVPARGFGVLQGNDGNIRKFTIHGVPVGVCLYPRAHTCFNRIDLPMYETKEDLEEKLKLAVTMCASGFDIE